MEIKDVKKLAPTGYRYLDHTAYDVFACSKNFKDLKAVIKNFTHSPNYELDYEQEDRLLSLDGTIPVLIRGSKYNIPICIYLRTDHPYNPPYCVVVPTAGMALTRAPWMDAGGFVYLPYLSEWKMGKSNLSDLVQVLIVTFGEHCPVYATNKSQPCHTESHSEYPLQPYRRSQSITLPPYQVDPLSISMPTAKIQQLKEKIEVKKSDQNDEKLQALGTSITEIQQELVKEKQQVGVLLEKLQQVEARSVELQQKLDKEEETSRMLQSKCNFLENTVISGLVERLEAVEVAVQAVERLWVVSRDEVHLSSNILGTGGWGFVKEATYRGRKVAAKCLHRDIISDHNQKQFEKEIKISARCRHQNLVEFIGAVPDHPAMILIEVMDTNLRDALTSRRVTPNHLHPVSVDVARGLSYLHGIQPQPIIHRDVSAPNVLLKAVGTGWIAKLSDLGSAQFAHIAHTVAPGCVLYAAPEVRQEVSAAKQTEKLDVYSYGVLLIEMLTREMPTGSIEALVDSLKPKWPRFVPLILNCTKIDPNLRPSMKNVIDQLDTITI